MEGPPVFYEDDTQDEFEWQGKAGRLHTSLLDCHPTNHDPEKRAWRATPFHGEARQQNRLRGIGRGRRGTVVVTRPPPKTWSVAFFYVPSTLDILYLCKKCA